METKHESRPAPLVFGPFELDPRAGELRKRGSRVRLAGQPLQILLLLLTRPGDLVTREELRDQLWSDGTFVDFEHGLNAAINKLRRALGDSAEHPRYVETTPGRGYRFVGTLETAASPPPAQEAPAGTREPLSTERRHALRWAVPGIALCIVAALVGTLQLRDSSARQGPWKLTRLTADPGISDHPALSPDGSLVAYASDRSLTNDRDPLMGGLDLHVKQVAGGSPVRLTFDGADNQMSDFSPDGSRIVFRSAREGGGIFEMPTLGGHARLVARDGFNPRFSPDGSHVAYWIGPRSVAASVPGSGAVWVVPTGGGQPKRVGENFGTARHPIWHPDGKHLLLVGYTSAKAFDSSEIDWWVVATDGSGAVRTGAHQALIQAGLEPDSNTRTPIPAVPQPRCWSTPGNKVTFSIQRGDSSNLWELEVSPRTGKVLGMPQRITVGAGNELRAACASGGALAFAKVDTRTDIWSLPFDLDRGVATGTPQRITEGPPWHENPSLSGDGRFLAFVSDRSGAANVWLRELATGKELTVASSPLVQRYPLSDPSGGRIAFSVYEKDKRVLYLSVPGGAPEKICEGCLRATDWSLDARSLLVHGGDPYHIALLDIPSRRRRPVVKHPLHQVLYGRFSPDRRWISFTVRVPHAGGRIVIAPADGPKPIDESAWFTIAEAGPDDYAIWSPDGKTLYFTSAKDGYSCLWGQRVDATSRRLVGEAFGAHHLHGRLSFGHGGWSAAHGRIALPLVETAGNLWLMSRTTAR